MSTVAYNCPACGAPLAYQGGKLVCAACGNQYDLDVIEAMQVADGGGVAFAAPEETFTDGDAQQMQAYICQGCGAELMTEDTTTATECPYCGSPTILPERIEGGVRPEYVVPFVVTKEQAQQQFTEYFKGKKLMPNVFLDGRNRISEMRRLFVPYWLFDCEARADIVYDAQKRQVRREGDWEVTYTDHYIVRRGGTMGFDAIPVDGSEKLDNAITESLEPYDLSAAVPFEPAVLAGALADHADVDAAACEARAAQRVENSIAQAMRSTVTGYTNVMERGRNIRAEGGRVTPVLMPVWLITTEKEGKTYTFAINGQTGKLTCDVPADTGKSLLWGFGTFAGVFALCAAILYAMAMMESGTLLIAGIIALVAAFIVVGGLTAQLRQAAHQSAAADYVRSGSFSLDVRYDRFLYQNVQRRRIEQPNQKR
ncbi:MAG: hypothetical protein J6K32_02805 [Clostridia bacterium]|nr:hypothetical protein [Clostridia bacterium]